MLDSYYSKRGPVPVVAIVHREDIRALLTSEKRLFYCRLKWLFQNQGFLQQRVLLPIKSTSRNREKEMGKGVFVILAALACAALAETEQLDPAIPRDKVWPNQSSACFWGFCVVLCVVLCGCALMHCVCCARFCLLLSVCLCVCVFIRLHLRYACGLI